MINKILLYYFPLWFNNYSNKSIISFQQGVTDGYPVAVSIVRIFYCICRSRKKNYSNSIFFPKFFLNLKNLLVIKIANLHHHFSSNWDAILLVKEQKGMIMKSSTKKNGIEKSTMTRKEWSSQEGHQTSLYRYFRLNRRWAKVETK